MKTNKKRDLQMHWTFFTASHAIIHSQTWFTIIAQKEVVDVVLKCVPIQFLCVWTQRFCFMPLWNGNCLCTEHGVLSAESNGRCQHCDSKRNGELVGKLYKKCACWSAQEMGRGETWYCWGEDWLGLTCWCFLLDGTNEVYKGYIGLRTIVRGVWRDPVVLEVFLRRTTWRGVWLETAIVVIRVVLVYN